MSESIETLREFGVDKIYRDTHIPVEYIRALLEADFSKFTKLQFLGFLAILEREYSLNLSSYKNDGLHYFLQKEDEIQKEINPNLFIPPRQPKNYIPFALMGVAAIILVIGYFSLDSVSNQDSISPKQDIVSPVITQQQVAMIQELNSTQKKEQNQSLQEQESVSSEVSENNVSGAQEVTEEESHSIEPKALPSDFTIKAIKRLWIGYIDLTHYKRYQKTFKGKLDLDPSKEWLLTLGHGYVNIIINGEIQKFRSRKHLRFHYKDGVLMQISKKEFKRFNKGRSW